MPCIVFTFHYVSTYTSCYLFFLLFSAYLHSTMFLLIRTLPIVNGDIDIHLHSTMFLLIPECMLASIRWTAYLHSTMFLLIPGAATQAEHKFTHLHSTMFLLILRPTADLNDEELHLHSTMILLIRRNRIRNYRCASFTFHYVSTYTSEAVSAYARVARFTFHYVSTYTNNECYVPGEVTYLHSTMFLLIHVKAGKIDVILFIYIPLCFYLYHSCIDLLRSS